MLRSVRVLPEYLLNALICQTIWTQLFLMFTLVAGLTLSYHLCGTLYVNIQQRWWYSGICPRSISTQTRTLMSF